MLTDRVPEPALQVLTTNSEGAPGIKRTVQKRMKRLLKKIKNKSKLSANVAHICSAGGGGDIYLCFLPAVQGRVLSPSLGLQSAPGLPLAR